MPIIDLGEILLRPIVEGDTEDVYAYSSNPKVGLAAGWKYHESLEETTEIMNLIFLGKEHIFGIVLKDGNKLVGSVGLMADPRRDNPLAMMLGYALAEPQWGQGIMTKAARAVVAYGFRDLGLGLISCTCYPDNRRSFRVIEKCGFKYEGRLRQCEVRYDGAVMDMECFSIIRGEWDGL